MSGISCSESCSSATPRQRYCPVGVGLDLELVTRQATYVGLQGSPRIRVTVDADDQESGHNPTPMKSQSSGATNT